MARTHLGRIFWAVLGCGLLAAGCGDDDGGTNQNGNQPDAGGIQCGDGVQEGIEECDDGPANSDTVPDACRTSCTLAGCGDGVVDSTEGCDEGPANSDAVPGACREDCTPPRCGDGVVDVGQGETCDCGDDPSRLPEGCTAVNGTPGGGCRDDCLVSYCGNGELDEGEVCDDGNLVPGDGCSPACNSDETCGNGVVDLFAAGGPEQCDDGNLTAGDGCSPTCQIEVCGNGHLDPGEVCDDGNLAAGDGCSPDCLSEEVCGNGYPDFGAGEQCDDGGLLSHDGCSSGCTAEFPTWSQVFSPFGAMAQLGFVWDSARDRMVVFGGEGFCGVHCDQTWVYDFVRWRRVPTAVSPLARLGAAMVYDPDRDRVVLFGGLTGLTSYDDTWEFDGTSWTQINTGARPAPRAHATMVYDGWRQVMVLFGGHSDWNNTSVYGDTWEYDGATGQWTQRSTTGAPPARYMHGMAFDSPRGVAVLHGGYVQSGSGEETWEYRGISGSWSLRVTTPTLDRQRTRLVFDEDRQVTVMFGGDAEGNVRSGETWEYDGVAGSWSQVSPASAPTPRVDFGLAWAGLQHGVVAFGGIDAGSALLQDLWYYDGVTWRPGPARSSPPPAMGVGVTYDPVRRRAVLFGGSQGFGPPIPATTWFLDEEGWYGRELTPSPTARSGSDLVWDVQRERAVLFGGMLDGAGLPTSETWELDGDQWVLRTGIPSPPSRANHTLAYDESRHAVLLFGGALLGGDPDDDPQDETWEYDGSGWSLLNPQHRPAARTYAMATFDASNQEVVLYGGLSATGTLFDELWVWDGLDWSLRTLPPQAPRPSERLYPALVYNPLRGRVLLYGGLTLAGYLRDLWEWDGVGFRELFSNAPGGRGFLKGVYHAALGRVVIQGGYDGNALDETWRFRFESAWPDEICDNGADDDHDGATDCADPDCEGQICAAGQVCQSGACVTP